MHNGVAIGEAALTKKIMLTTGVNVAGEFKVKNNWYLTVSGGGLLLRYSSDLFPNGTLFNNHYFANIIVSVRKYLPINQKAAIFYEFGIVSSYLFNSKSEYRFVSNNYSETKKDLGYNFGLHSNFGFKTKITNTLSFDIGITGQDDIFFVYSNATNKLKCDKRLITFSFYRKLQ